VDRLRPRRTGDADAAGLPMRRNHDDRAGTGQSLAQFSQSRAQQPGFQGEGGSTVGDEDGGSAEHGNHRRTWRDATFFQCRRHAPWDKSPCGERIGSRRERRPQGPSRFQGGSRPWWEPTLSAMGACGNLARCRGIADKVGSHQAVSSWLAQVVSGWLKADWLKLAQSCLNLTQACSGAGSGCFQCIQRDGAGEEVSLHHFAAFGQ